MSQRKPPLSAPVVRLRTVARGPRSARCLFRLSAALGVCVTLAATVTANGRDILRSGRAPAAASSRGGVAPNVPNSAITSQARTNALDSMARTTRALQSVQAMQAAARAAAIAGANNLGANPRNPAVRLPNVPNGLATGGLQVAPGATLNSNLWQGANLPTQTASGGKTQVNVKQTSQQAILNWKTFNVGKETTLKFDQSAGGANKGQWIAFNKVNDPSGVPSQILGSIKADGQVYVVNRNGIIFGGSSQVNVHTLAASSLSINESLIKSGLLNNPKAEFLFSATDGGPVGDVTVQAGAMLTSPTTAEHVGGRILLAGPNVSNAGTIETPDGQTVLAAGLEVGIAAHASTDPSLRGLDVFVGTVGPGTGKAENSGLISAPRASVVMTGKTVNQLGVIDSSTSVALNGRVDLLADYDAGRNPAYDPVNLPTFAPFFFRSVGTVTLGEGSAVRLLPELSSTETVASTRLPLGSQINVRGQAIHLAAGSFILAPSAKVSLQAGLWDSREFPGSPPITQFVYTNSATPRIEPQIYLDRGATIDVAGSTDVPVPIKQNILSVELRGSELADSPLQRSGDLRGSTLLVDLRVHGPWDPTLNDGAGDYTWVGTPLANAKGYRDLVKRSVGELTTSGGTVNLRSGGSVVLQPGSTVNVSAGWIDFAGGTVQTSRLIAGGRLVDVSKATPDQIYDGIFTAQFAQAHPKWGVQSIFANSLALSGSRYEAGYLQAANGGSIVITAPSMALDGRLLGNTPAGPRQRADAPAATSLSLVFQQQDQGAQHFPFSPTPPAIVFQNGVSLTPVDPFALDGFGNPSPLPAERQTTVALSPDLLAGSGFGKLTVDNGDGTITVPTGVSLDAPARGSISLAAANLNIAGHVAAPGGTLEFAAYNFTPFIEHAFPIGEQPSTPSPDPTRGVIQIGKHASLSTAGLMVDDRFEASDFDGLPIVIDGGKISIQAYSANLARGSTVDVSGGIQVTAAGKRTFGKGGSIDIKAGQDPKIASLIGGKISLGASLLGFSGTDGGALKISAPLVQIRGAPPPSAPGSKLDFDGTLVDRDAFLLLSPEFFNQGGFQSFTVSGLGFPAGQEGAFIPGLKIARGTVISPQVRNFIANPFGSDSGKVELVPTLLPREQRSGVSLTLGAAGIRDSFQGTLISRGDFVMESGAVIRTDPFRDAARGVTISGDTVSISGAIIAPGGSIRVSGSTNPAVLFLDGTRARATVELTRHAMLSTAGTPVLYEGPRGFVAGTILGGGTINVSGNIVADKGAVLDVSGSSGIIDLNPFFSGQGSDIRGSFAGQPMIPTRVDSNAGKIVLKGGQLLFSDATLKGHASGSRALGASLELSSGLFIPPGEFQTPLDVTLTVRQQGNAIPNAIATRTGSVIGQPVIDVEGIGSSGGYVSTGSFRNGGLDRMNLRGTVRFTGSGTVSAGRELRVADGGVIFADNATKLSAPYVALGTAFRTPLSPQQLQQQTAIFFLQGNPFYFAPTYGNGTLTVRADLIDVGNLSLQGIGKADFVATNGDIRGVGFLNAAGHVSLTAAQIYPPTAVSFSITAFDYTADGNAELGSIRIAAAGSRNLPLSAGGELNIYASNIIQGGILRAPIGRINLGWNGEGAAPNNLITGTTAPYPVSQNVTLVKGSVTSVSAANSGGGGTLLPYGLVLNGTQWIDPAGSDITPGGIPGKTVNIAGINILNQAGSLIDISGGGDLFAYRWVPGTGGTKDILNSKSQFAVLPGFQGNYAPYAPFNPAPTTDNLGGDPGYVVGNFAVGDRVFLQAGGGLAGGNYTILPARYALLPGAFLISPLSDAPTESISTPDGAAIVSGYRTGQSLFQRFEVASSQVTRSRAQYDLFFANSFLRRGAQSNNTMVPRLPIDGGRLTLRSSRQLSIHGQVVAQALAGRGGLVDIASLAEILISESTVAPQPGVQILSPTELNSFRAESLMIGGTRQTEADGEFVSVRTGGLTLDNQGHPLTGPEIILVANQRLTLAPGAEIQQSKNESIQADTLLLGRVDSVGSILTSGDGLLLRATGDLSARIVRSGVTPYAVTSANADAGVLVPRMEIGIDTRIAARSLTLDSTFYTSLPPQAEQSAEAISINSGRVVFLTETGIDGPRTGLILTGKALESVQAAKSLSVLGYSSIDVYGAGRISTPGDLAFHTPEIRGFATGGNTATFAAPGIITLDNSPGGTGPGPDPALGGTLQGTLAFNAGTIQVGRNQLQLSHYQNIELNATGDLVLQGVGGLSTLGNLSGSPRMITAAAGAVQSISALGDLALNAQGAGAGPSSVGGLGATVTLTGASVIANSDILLPGGSLALRATGSGGDVTVGGRIDVGGTAQQFFDLTKYTSAGEIRVESASGGFTLGPDGELVVAAQAGGGNAGRISITVPGGGITINGQMLGKGGAGGQAGTFVLDASSLPSLAATTTILDMGGFTQSRSYRVRTGNVTIDAAAKARAFSLSADQGSITVTGAGSIDASGATGGAIRLAASGSVILESGSVLSVEADNFSSAGKGGAISLEAGSAINGIVPSTDGVRDPVTGRFADGTAVVDIQAGSLIKLGVKSVNAESASLGRFNGMLHLRAPQTADGLEVQVNPVKGTIAAASSIAVEGYRMFDLSDLGGFIDGTVQFDVLNNGTNFAANTTAIMAAVFSGLAAQEPVISIRPGVEIINRGFFDESGSLFPGTGDLTMFSDWDLGPYRFGPKNAPGFLTMRAAGNLIFNGALSDGFARFGIFDPLDTAPLMAENPLLPVNSQSWSYRLVAGADGSAADFRLVQAKDSLPDTSGSLLLGNNYPGLSNLFIEPGPEVYTSQLIFGLYQVIRTGSGDIDISVGRDLKLLNPFATIYTAGTQLAEPTKVTASGDFDLPIPLVIQGEQGNLGGLQNPWNPQYSRGGGNVTITAQGDISHQTMNLFGELVADSGRQIPTNWLNRRSSIATDGHFNVGIYGDVTSTTWGIDFGNFFQGVGALGGGNVTLQAGGSIANVDAVVPTNARMAGKDASGAPLSAVGAAFIEHGGGDLVVRAGRDIDGGIYYVERGSGTLEAGRDITTNATRAPSTSVVDGYTSTPAPETWLPTTLFLGDGKFDVTARGNVTLGPTLNAFLAPPGLSNSFRYKTYFSTFTPETSVNVTSTGGDIDLRGSSVLPDGRSGPVFLSWLSNVSLLPSIGLSVSSYEPWIRLGESAVEPFITAVALNPATLRVTAFSGDINLAGDVTLAPAPRGTIDLIAAKAINGLRPNGAANLGFTPTTVWDSSKIIVSDSSPAGLPGITSPLEPAGLANPETDTTALFPLDDQFAESGSTLDARAVIQAKLALHDPASLHLGDPEPIHLYAQGGNLADLTLFSPKAARVFAQNDITDVGLYVQNTSVGDFTVVSAGRDIIAFNPNSPLLFQAQAEGNTTLAALSRRNPALSGDIQISGPGTIEILAGRELNLGTGRNDADPADIGVGVSSIGNNRNPALPFNGARVVLGAGVGGPSGLVGSALDFTAFTAKFLTPENRERYLREVVAARPELAGLSFEQLPENERAGVALDVFYLILRDAGRDHNVPESPGFGNFDAGFAAIASLFPGNSWKGNIDLSSRSVKTTNGGDISIVVPGGGLNLGFDIPDNDQAPPGVVTEFGGNISIFTDQSVQVGALRIFTLRGGNEIIWSSKGDIAAGTASKTVQTAPPTRVVIDPQAADVRTDLAGLATGGGIGVLATVAGVAPGNVDLIAPSGVIDAGDAGIRSTGNLNVAAVQILNASNVQAGGSSSGTPAPAASAPSIAAVPPPPPTQGPGGPADKVTRDPTRREPREEEEKPSIIVVEVLGYGGD